MEQIGKFLQELIKPKPFLADCPHCSKDGEKKILKYRGSVKCVIDNGNRETLKNWKVDKRIEELFRYAPGCLLSLTSGGEGKSLYSYTFVACDECIQPEHIPAFTYFPNGWDMTVFKSKHYGPYDEEINFDLLEEASSPQDKEYLPSPVLGLF